MINEGGAVFTVDDNPPPNAPDAADARLLCRALIASCGNVCILVLIISKGCVNRVANVPAISPERRVVFVSAYVNRPRNTAYTHHLH